MPTVTLTVPHGEIGDTMMDQSAPLAYSGLLNWILLGDPVAAPPPGGLKCHGLISFRVPEIPKGGIITGYRLYLYKSVDTNNGLSYHVYAYTAYREFSEYDAGWQRATQQNNWAAAGHAEEYFLSNTDILLNNVPGWHNWVLTALIKQITPKGGDLVNIMLYALNFAGNQSATFVSSDDAANQPYVEIDVDVPATGDLNIAPDVGDKRRPKLTWTPMEGVVITNQKIYRRAAAAGVTPAHTLVATLDGTVKEYTDTSIDAAGSDGVDYCYAVFTETTYNSGMNAFKGNEVTFIRPAITTFYVQDDAGNEGANIDVLERTHCFISGAGGTLTQTYIDWSDSGAIADGLSSKWFTLGVTQYHWYTTTGAKLVRAKAINSLGFESNLYAVTGAHVNPNPTAIIPIGVLEVAPINAKPYEKITCDAYKSYARQSDGSIQDYSYTAAGSLGLPAQPQVSARAEIYYKTTGNKVIQVVARDNGLRNAAAVQDTAIIAAESLVKLSALSGTKVAVRSLSKEQHLDVAPYIGEDIGTSIRTGAGNPTAKIQGACIGNDCETNWRIIQAWADSGKTVDIEIPNALGVVDLIFRGILKNLAWEHRGGEEDARYWNADMVIYVRLKKVTDEVVAYAAGVGHVANYPIADYDGDGLLTDDVTVTGQVVSDIDYVGDDPDAALSEVILVGALNGNANTSYWYEEKK